MEEARRSAVDSYGYTVADSRQEVTLRMADNTWCCRSLTRSGVYYGLKEVMLRVADKKLFIEWLKTNDVADSRKEVVLRIADKKWCCG